MLPDKNEFGQEPNSLTSPITLGMPGVLPVLNKEVVNMGILTGLALNCEIPEDVNLIENNTSILIFQKVIKFHNMMNQFV